MFQLSPAFCRVSSTYFPPPRHSLLCLSLVWTCIPCASWPVDKRVKVTGRDGNCPQRDVVSFCLSSERESASPKWKPQPKLTMTERKQPRLNPDGDWTLSLVRSGATFTCNTEKVPPGTCWTTKSMHEKWMLCKTPVFSTGAMGLDPSHSLWWGDKSWQQQSHRVSL